MSTTQRMLTFIKQLVRRCLRRGSQAPGDWRAENEARIARWRTQGVRIGQGCVVLTESFSTEPYLVELGDRVGVAGGVQFLTHDGAMFLLRSTRPDGQHLGRVVVGDDSYLGQNCLLLPGTRIGRGCIVGAGSVVRGTVPDNSLVAGNPARIVGRASLALARLRQSEDTVDTLRLPADERRRAIEAHFGVAGSAENHRPQPRND